MSSSSLQYQYHEDDLNIIPRLVRIYEKKLWAVIKIQSHIRRLIAMRQYRKMRVRRRQIIIIR